MKKKALYIDMDGTLARFHDADKLFIEAMWTPGFYVGLKPFENLVKAIKLFIERHSDVDVNVLSAVLDTDPPFIEDEKNVWFDNYLPEIDKENRIFTKAGEDKSEYIDMESADCFLLDDYNKNLYEFEAANGHSIKFHNDVNHRGLGEYGGSKGNLWEGAIVHYNDSPEKICRDLEEIVFGKTMKFGENVLEPEKDKVEDDEFVLEDNRLIHYTGNSDTVVIPEGVEVIGFNAFWNSKNLKLVQFPSTLKEIESGAFAGCDLQELKLPNGLKTIDEDAFSGCNSLKEVSVPGSIEYIDPNAFYNCEKLTDINVSVWNEKYCSLKGVLYYRDSPCSPPATNLGTLTLLRCPTGVNIVDVNSVTSKIGYSAFKGCTELVCIHLPEALKEICSQAFRECASLEEIFVPKGVTDISIEAFADCKNLRRVFLPDSLTYMGDRIFDGCKNLEEIVISDEALVRYCEEFDLLDQVFMTPCYEKLNARYKVLAKQSSIEDIINDASERAAETKCGTKKGELEKQ